MRFVWPESVRAELRGIDRESAMRILIALTHYGESGVGDIKAFQGNGMDAPGFVPGLSRDLPNHRRRDCDCSRATSI